MPNIFCSLKAQSPTSKKEMDTDGCGESIDLELERLKDNDEEIGGEEEECVWLEHKNSIIRIWEQVMMALTVTTTLMNSLITKISAMCNLHYVKRCRLGNSTGNGNVPIDPLISMGTFPIPVV